MKSKLKDAELIAEAYAKVEVQQEGLGALAGGIGRIAKKVAKKGLKAAGGLAKDVAVETGRVAAEVGGEGLKAAGKAAGSLADKAINAADRGISKLAGDEEHDSDWPAADHDAPKGGLGSRSMDEAEDGEKETKALEVKVADAELAGGIDKSDAASIMRMHHNSEDAEHDAPIEVDMSVNPAPESLEVTKEEEPDHEPCAMEAPPIAINTEMPDPMNHQDRSEMEMAKAELYKLEKYSFKLGQMLDLLPSLEGWTASKITKAADYLSSVYHKLDYDLHGDDKGIHSEDHEGH